MYMEEVDQEGKFLKEFYKEDFVRYFETPSLGYKHEQQKLSKVQ